MGNFLSAYTSSRDNNFNLIRFIAASLVLFSHSFALAIGSVDAEPLRGIVGMAWGGIAVDIFFITSGFLITGSYVSKHNVIAFMWARVLRIYPALIIAVIFCVYGVGLFFTTHSIEEYLSNYRTLKYLIKNSILIFGVDYKLPGVFLTVPYKETVNGSLWTLPYEIKMYALLAVIMGSSAYLARYVKFLSMRNVTLLVCVISTLLHVVNNFYSILPESFIRLFSMFFLGAAFYIWKDKVLLSPKILSIGFPLLILSSLNKDLFFVLYCVLLPFFVFYLAYIPSGFIRKFNNFGDYSYGIYIYAFPVQQSIASVIPHVSVPTMIVLSFFCTLTMSIISWHLIEKRFLSMKGLYIHIENITLRKFIRMRKNKVR